MDTANLELVAERLRLIDQDECREALALVQKAIMHPDRVANSKGSLALCHALWDCMTRALDHGDFSDAERACLDALEAEMAGRTCCARLALGWMVRSPTAPALEPSLSDVGLSP